MEITSTTATFETKSHDALFELVHRAAKAAASDELDSGGMLEIRPVDDRAFNAGGVPVRLAVDAAFSEDGLRRTIAKLDVHLRVELATFDAPVIGQAVERFGGTKYTNLCFATPGDPRDQEDEGLDLLRPGKGAEDALDVTVDTSANIPIYASNLALVSDRLSEREADAAAKCLKHLGVSFSRRGKTSIRVARRQLRGPMRAESQAAAFLTLAELDLDVSLYAAVIPTTRSLRLASRRQYAAGGDAKRVLEFCFSRGLAGVEPTTKEQVSAIEEYLREHFDLTVGGRRWVVEGRKWTANSEPEIRKRIDH